MRCNTILTLAHTFYFTHLKLFHAVIAHMCLLQTLYSLTVSLTRTGVDGQTPNPQWTHLIGRGRTTQHGRQELDQLLTTRPVQVCSASPVVPVNQSLFGTGL